MAIAPFPEDSHKFEYNEQPRTFLVRCTMILDDLKRRKSCTVANPGQAPASGPVRRPPPQISASERHLPHSHPVVWIDHHEAPAMYFNAADATTKPVLPP